MPFKMRSCIRDIEPSTSSVRRNVYHLHVPLYVLDIVRQFQDHPRYACGIKEEHIVAELEKEPFSCGDCAAQVKMALKELTSSGFVRYVRQGYRTLGPFAKLAQARTQRQMNIAWNKLNDLQKISTASLNSSNSSCSNNTRC